MPTTKWNYNDHEQFWDSACDWTMDDDGLRGIESLRRRSVLIAGSVKMVAIRMQFTLYLVLLLNIYNSFVSALYFHIGETEKKCFIEEIPDETMIIGK